MKKVLPLLGLLACIVLLSCGGSKNTVGGADGKSISQLVRKTAKDPYDFATQEDLKTQYRLTSAIHLENIEGYKALTDISKWDKILGEYYSLQQLYNTISTSTVAFNAVKPVNYTSAQQEVREAAAEEWYLRASQSLEGDSREDARQAWTEFKHVQEYVPNYRDSRERLREAFDKATVDVVILPLRESNNLFAGWIPSIQGMTTQEKLVRELGGSYATDIPARFYTDREATRRGVQPQWIVDVEWSEMRTSEPRENRVNKSVSKQIQNGKDSLGRPVYTTVFAILYVTELTITAHGEMSWRINDRETQRQIASRSIRDQVEFTGKSATFTGDSRALSQEDWNLVRGSNGSRAPQKQEIRERLMQEMYPQLLSGLRSQLRW
jgi:hypothetical protein